MTFATNPPFYQYSYYNLLEVVQKIDIKIE
nr:MAG TPA: hypothetical protein [Caudoviricetes sp.]